MVLKRSEMPKINTIYGSITSFNVYLWYRCKAAGAQRCVGRMNAQVRLPGGMKCKYRIEIWNANME